MKLSKHFSLWEFTASQTATRLGIDNTPTDEHLDNLIQLCQFVLEPIREQFGPVHVSSGYRSPQLNVAVGGSTTSQHCNGQAADIEIPGLDNCDLANWIANNLDFDQLILEFHNHQKGPNDGWVHVSYTSRGMRKSVLTAIKQNGKTKYLNGLVS